MAVDLSQFIDYGQYFSEYIDDPRFSTGKQQQAVRCPFPDHDDGEASFSVNLTTGKWQCFGCGRQGNVTSFEAAMHGTSTKEAYKHLCEKYNVPSDEAPKPAARKPLESLTVAQYAAAKHLDESFLRAAFFLKDGRFGGADVVEMPYLTEAMHHFRTRVRAGAKTMRWGKKGAAWEDGKTPLYGVWLLGEDDNTVVLVEGESDTQTLRSLGIAAVGAAGAANVGDNAAVLSGRDVVVHDDGDAGGKVFLQRCREALGDVRSFRCRDIDATCKDPSDVLIKYGADEAARKIREAIKGAEAAKVVQRAPAGYAIDDGGVWKANERGEARVTATPVTMSAIVHDIVTNREKVELSWLTRRGVQRSEVFERDIVLSSRRVVDVLAPLGVNVSTGNAKEFVEYLTACDAELGGGLPVIEATSRLGWLDEERFAPWVDGVMMDAGGGGAQRVAAVTERGDLDWWRCVVGDSRANLIFRFILAASFASPLLRVVDGRPMFINIWGSSRFGKSAALKAALSVWGDPNRLMTTFQSTLNALCGIAELMCDLPVGIDERQSVSGVTLAQKQKNVEEIVYTLSGGHRKDRSTVTGGLQDTGQWHGLFITTGEEPILKDNTMTGVASRTIELNERPFYTEADARAMHDGVARQYGTAGKVFLRRVQELGWAKVRDIHADMEQSIGVSSIYLDTVAMICAADYISECAVFGREDEGAAWEYAVAMGKDILVRLADAESTDVNRSAVEFVEGWLYSNKANFDNSFGATFGTFIGGEYRVVPSVLRDALGSAGFDYTKTMRYMAEHGLIECEESGGKRRFTKRKSGGSFVCISSLSVDRYMKNGTETEAMA